MLFLGMLALIAWCFLPGLGGTFIFDDLPNLLPWSALQDIDSGSKLLTFVFSSKFLPGRPLSLLSFLVDDQSWPPSIHLLKQTNLAIHLLNTCMVFWLSLRLLECMLPARPRSALLLASVLVAAIWGLHPMQVSTVSYIIQRMCLLSTLFTLIALLLFVQGRSQLETRPSRALLLCSIGIGVFMPLAILAKETGLLICVLALLVEAFCFRPNRLLAWRLWRLAFLVLPLLLFLVYCLVTYRFFTRGFEIRDFNALERLLTQGPVLLDYLHKLLLPSFGSGGLFFDNYPVSRSLFNPPGTAFAWLVVLALIAGAWLLRRRYPVAAFGVLFFFAGHLMESTVLPLELYFEHRNYLPQLGLWIALAGILIELRSPLLRLVTGTALAAWFLLLVFITRNNAALWGNPDLQAAVWYQQNPGSLRTTLVYVNVLMRNNQVEALDVVLKEGRRHFPNSMNLLLTQRVVDCFGKNLPTPFADLPAFARHADYDNSLITVLEQLRKARMPGPVHSQGCQPPDLVLIAGIYHGLLANPGYQGIQGNLYQYLGEVAQASGNPPLAVSYYTKAFEYGGSPIYAFRTALLLESLGDVSGARKYLTATEQALGWRDRVMNPDFPERIRKARESLSMPLPESAP